MRRYHRPQLGKALKRQHEHAELGLLGQVLLALKMISAERLGLTLAQQLSIARQPGELRPTTGMQKLLPESLARRYLMIVLMLDSER